MVWVHVCTGARSADCEPQPLDLISRPKCESPRTPTGLLGRLTDIVQVVGNPDNLCHLPKGFVSTRRSCSREGGVMLHTVVKP